MNKRKDVIPNNLRTYRKALGLKQQEVALKLGFTSVDRISYWEQGVSIPNLINLLKLSILYRATPMQLYGDLLDKLEEEMEERKINEFQTTVL